MNNLYNTGYYVTIHFMDFLGLLRIIEISGVTYGSLLDMIDRNEIHKSLND